MLAAALAMTVVCLNKRSLDFKLYSAA